MARQLNFNEQPKNPLLPLVLVFLLTAVITGSIVTGLVMPVYFGIDPFGWGAKLSLVSPTNSATANNLAANQTLQANNPPNQIALTGEQVDDPLSVRSDTVELAIPAQQSLDYRVAMARDYDLDYHWKANNPKLYMELRGESKGGRLPDKTFSKITGAAGKGYFITPFEGQFGWHWENKSDQPVTIKLSTKGHYQVVGQINSSVLKKQ